MHSVGAAIEIDKKNDGSIFTFLMIKNNTLGGIAAHCRHIKGVMPRCMQSFAIGGTLEVPVSANLR